MCTSIAWHRGSSYFGRNLDMEASFGESVVVTPRNYLFRLKNGGEYRTRHAMMGMGIVMGDQPMYYEVFNEKGLAMAGLNFPESAVYLPPVEEKTNIAPFELIPWIAGQAANLGEARALLEQLHLSNQTFSTGVPASPMHFMISDRTGSLVAEPTAEGLKLYDDPYEVMTNEPPFPVQEWNLRRYRNLSPANGPTAFSGNMDLRDYGVGMGAVGLPGDNSGPSRFVRAAFHLANSCGEDTEEASVSQFFHVLDSVSMIRGSTLTNGGKADLTLYSCCMNLDRGIYYYTTYDNRRITALWLERAHPDGESLTVYPLCRDQSIRVDN